MWLIRQTREQQQGRRIIGGAEPKGNTGNVDNMGNMDSIRGNDEEMMSQYDGKQGRNGQVLKSVDEDYKKRGSGSGRTMDGKIRILKREKDLRLKRKVDGRIRILKRKNLTK